MRTSATPAKTARPRRSAGQVRSGTPRTGIAARIASGRDPAGLPVHRGWAPLGGRRRWMEPFVLVLLAEGPAHGYAMVGQLEEMGIFSGEVDVGAVYRTLRDLEASAHVTSMWSVEPGGARRREYALTDAGYGALDEWASVMRERARLAAEFDARYLAAVAVRRVGGTRRGRERVEVLRGARPSRGATPARARPSAGRPARPRGRR